jgi:diguanylate cyclase (GGDEF)-like protein
MDSNQVKSQASQQRWKFIFNPEPDLGELEGAYRESNLNSDLDLVRLLVVLGLIYSSIYSLIDYQLFSLSQTLVLLGFVRFLFFLSSLVLLLAIQKITTYRQMDNLVLIWVMILTVTVLYIDSTRPKSYYYNATIDLVILIAIYTTMPTPFHYRIIPSLALSIGETVIFTMIRTDVTPVGIHSIVMGIILGNIIGMLVSTRLNILRRNQFISQHKEHRAHLEVERLSRVDDLTQVLNRRRFLELAEQEIARYRRYKHPFSFLIIDLDNFKRINDVFGHLAGDLALKHYARIFSSGIREIDLVGRLGGEEFALLFPETRLEKAIDIAERIRHTCEMEWIETEIGVIHTTICIGLTEIKNEDISFEHVFQRADQALYHAKEEGRNKVKVG